MAQVLSFNDQRRNAQNQLDKNLAEVNAISKSIGMLMKQGQKEEAEAAKARVAEFKEASKTLQAEMDKAQAQKGKPIMGICLGMQLLFEKSYEYGFHEGLGLIEGAIRPIADVVPVGYKIPHIGWNALHFGENKHPLFEKIKEGDAVYFVHSYYADCKDAVIATAEYGAPLTAAVAKGNVLGCQFHPEKSGDVGLDILRAFCEREDWA
ncbi:MAG: imidazole glycerol phosphate synthase subunit HisH [Clostridia bacterium]|nr:imidazole glycerol phosphate synthase subunit HisH [Clostridia bacterium]